MRIVTSAFLSLLTYIYLSFTGGVALRVTYGYDVATTNDKYVRLGIEAGGPLLQVVIAGMYLVDYIPTLKYIPCEYEVCQWSVVLIVSHTAWFPGAKFKRQAKEWEKLAVRLRDSPFEFVKTAMVWLCTLNSVL